MIRLHLTSGRAPAEGRIALGDVVAMLVGEAAEAGLGADVAPDRHGPGSVVVMLSGEGTATFAARWCGSVQRVARSTLRPGHQRKNWFVGITLLPEVPASAVLDPGDVKTEAFRAGGPGGQHQNVTDSAVRATHGPTVLAVVVRGDRSQHRNKAEALRRLGLLVAQSGEADRLAADRVGQAAHDRLVRGAPVRVLR